jgi:hypothetical protein
MENTTLQTLQQIARNIGIKDEPAGDKRRPYWIFDQVNEVKFELDYSKHRKAWYLIVAYFQPEIAEVLKDEFDWILDMRGAKARFNSPEELQQAAQTIKDFIIENEIQGVGRRPKTRRTNDDGYFETTAKGIKAIVDLEAWDLLDGRLGFDFHDKLIKVGESKAVQANPDAPQWREHIVPCTFIKEEAIRMAQANEPIAHIAQMLKENLAIVIITAEEAKKLDAVYQTTMPNGWSFGDDVFARLDAMNIAY